MESQVPNWHTEYKGHKIKIWRRQLSGTTVYYVSSSDDKKPLVITRAVAQKSGNEFWTSVPQGMQQAAEEIGAIIDKLES